MDFLIALLGVMALLMFASDQRATRAWGAFVGLLGQPFWLWQSWHAGLWGIFVCSVLYTFVWVFSLWKECRHDQR